jgi:hypothetical protein
MISTDLDDQGRPRDAFRISGTIRDGDRNRRHRPADHAFGDQLSARDEANAPRGIGMEATALAPDFDQDRQSILA